MKHGFFGLIAAGSQALFVMQAIHEPANTVVEAEAVQAEAVVEALQTQLWGGSFDMEEFLQGVTSASAARGRQAFDFSDIDAKAAFFDAALALLDRWNRVPYFQSMELLFG